MKALVFKGPGSLEVEEIPDPVPGPGEALIEVTAAGICGTDRHIFAGELGVAPGTVPGHEIAGRVEALGDGVDGLAVGQRVVSYGQVTCGKCWSCETGHSNRCQRPQVMGMSRQGGFAEKVAVPGSILLPIPDVVSDEIGAITADAIATPFHALVTIGALVPGETVVLVGAGGLGLQAVKVARLAGAGRVVVIDPSDEAREAAIEAGADEAIDPGDTDDPGKHVRSVAPDTTLAVEMVGRAETVELGLAALRPGGRLVVVGVGHGQPRLPALLRFVAGELVVRASFGSTMPEIATMLDLIARGRFPTAGSISKRVHLDEVPAVLGQPFGPGRTVIVPEE